MLSVKPWDEISTLSSRNPTSNIIELADRFLIEHITLRGIENAERQIMRTSEYVPNLFCGIRVRFIGENHRKSGQPCTIVAILPNPSRRAENQWYDVRFDDYSMGRFVERYLMRDVEDGETTAA